MGADEVISVMLMAASLGAGRARGASGAAPGAALRDSVEEKRGVEAGPELTWTFAGGKSVCGIEVVAEDIAAR